MDAGDGVGVLPLYRREQICDDFGWRTLTAAYGVIASAAKQSGIFPRSQSGLIRCARNDRVCRYGLLRAVNTSPAARSPLSLAPCAVVKKFGDVASPVRDPELDYLTGAWIGGRVDAMSKLLKIADEKTRIVPGFGPVMNRTELQAERDMMKTIYDSI